MAETKYFRNKIIILGIDPDSLWEKKRSDLVLVDDDQDLRIDYETCKDDFYLVDPPEELN